jgi:hypothetical protein
MSTDRNPPTITISNAEGRYLSSGIFISEKIQFDERILSITPAWNATIPTDPSGCKVAISISVNGGQNWYPANINQELIFATPDKDLQFKVELSSDPYEIQTPVFQDITIAYTKESYPFNVKLDLNSDGRDEWSLPGRFNTTAILNESTMGLATWLQQVVPRTGSGLFTVSLKFSSEKPGILRVYGINITGNYRPEALQLIPDIVMTENIPYVNAFNVNNYFRHLDEDKLEYITIGNRNVILNISGNGSVGITTTLNWYGEEHFILRAVDAAGEWADIPMDVEVRHVLQPPRFVAAMPNVTVEEGETVFSAFNLLEYVFDPDNPKTSLIFSVADVSNPNVSVSMDVNDNIEVRSKAGWDGNAVVKIKVSDGELSAIASFNVTVVRHNRPPVISNLPPVQLEQDGTLDRSFNIYNFTTDTDTPKGNITFRIDDNTNPRSGVTLTSDGWVNIRPDKGWSGTALVVVNVSDGEFGVRASFTVTVTPKAVTPKPTPTTDNTLNYLLIALVVVMMVFLAVDIGMRLRKPGHPVQYVQAPPEAQAPRPVPVVRKTRVQPTAQPSRTRAAEASQAAAEPAALEVQVLPSPPEIPAGGEAPPAPQEPPARQAPEGYGGAASAPERNAATAPTSPPERQYDFSQSEVVPGVEGGMAPVPSAPETPPESVPDMTAPAGASDTGGWHAEPETMEMDQQAQPPEEPASTAAPTGFYGAPAPTPAPEIDAGEVEQRPAGTSAASLLASLQKPVPKLESEAAAPVTPAAPEAPAQPPAAEHAEPSLVSKATEAEHAPAEVEQKEVRPITRVRCAGCKSAIPIFSAQRPLVVTCPQCGRMGMLK